MDWEGVHPPGAKPGLRDSRAPCDGLNGREVLLQAFLLTSQEFSQEVPRGGGIRQKVWGCLARGGSQDASGATGGFAKYLAVVVKNRVTPKWVALNGNMD